MRTPTGEGMSPVPRPRDLMIIDTHTNAKVVTRTYRQLMGQAIINRNRVSEHQADWLAITSAVGTGAYDNEARGWMDCPDWEGSKQRFTPLDGPGHKGVEP